MQQLPPNVRTVSIPINVSDMVNETDLLAVDGAYDKPAAIQCQRLVFLQAGHHELARNLYQLIGLELQWYCSVKRRLHGLYIELDRSGLRQQCRCQLGSNQMQLHRHDLV